MQKTVLLYFALLFWFVVPAKAQLTFSLPQLTVDTNQEVIIDFEVENFDEIFTTQFTFRWDPEILTFVDTLNIQFPDFQPEVEINLQHVADGYFVLAWADLTLAGFSLEDGDAFMQVKFMTIGDPGDTSILEFSDNPLNIMAGDINNPGPIPLETNNGWLAISGTSSIITPEDFGWIVNAVFPNPFSANTTIDFYTPTSTTVEWSIFDVVGKTIYKETLGYTPGQHTFILEQHLLPAEGTYFVQLRHSDFIKTQKVDFIK